MEHDTLNENQRRSLDLLNAVIKRETDGKTRKRGEKGDPTGPYIPSALMLPPHDLPPEKWPDWCAGWFYEAGPWFAEALGVNLITRTRSEDALDEHGQKIPERDENGAVKKDEKGRIVFHKNKFYWTEWDQSSNFCFRDGYTISMRPNENLLEMDISRPVFSVQVIAAIPVRPSYLDEEKKRIPRNPGRVEFERYHVTPERRWKKDLERIVTQDEFVRYLITGQLPETEK